VRLKLVGEFFQRAHPFSSKSEYRR
jgi:hypothetical protein